MSNYPKKETVPEDSLSTDHLAKDLKKRSVRGGVITLASQGTRFILQMGSTTILARLLSPSDYGLIGMATIFTGFIELFKHMGLSAATVQRMDINHRQISTLFWINVGLGVVMTCIAAAGALVVAWFYDVPELRWIVLALAPTFFLSSLNAQHLALLTRQMRYRTLAYIEIITMLSGVLAAITAAIAGWGYWALVVMQLTTVGAAVVMVWCACHWRPAFPDWQSGIAPFLSYGSNLTGFQVFNYISRNLDNMLIGRVWGAQELGLYNKAYQLVLFPILQINNPISNVALPTLSRLQDNPERYRRYYYKALTAITMLGMPVVGFMFVAADRVILLLLGENWIEVVPIFRWLMPAAFMATFNVATGWVYQSFGRTDKQFRWGIVTSITNALLFIFAVRWGATGIAIVFSCSRLILFIPALQYCYKDTPLNIFSLFKALYMPTVSSLGAAALVMIVNASAFSNTDNHLAFLLNGVLYAFTYCLVWLIMPGGKVKLFEIIEILRSSR